MRTAFLLFVLLGEMIASGLLFAAVVRDPVQVRAYRHDHACPSTGKTTGACPNYVVDHIKPLCLGGADHPDNMIWQEKKESLEKDKVEWAMCRWIDTQLERKAAEGGQ